MIGPAVVVLIVVVLDLVVVAPTAPDQWQVHSAEIKLGFLEQLVAQAGSAVVAVTVVFVKEAQKAEATAELLAM